MIGMDGELSTSFYLNYRELSIASLCGVTHENNLLIYGYDDNVVLQVVNCSLTSIGTIPFDHEWGACDSSNGLIVLCFDYYDNRQCRQSSTPLGSWSEMTPSTFDHKLTQIATSPGK